LKILTIFANENTIRKSKAQSSKLKINPKISKSKIKTYNGREQKAI
jgi:hypothetical protein